MRVDRAVLVIAAAALLGGCAATTASLTEPPAGQGESGGQTESGGAGGGQTEGGELVRGPFPSAATMSETAPEADAGQPEETLGLSVVEKRHLYARRVMASCVENAPNFLQGLESSALTRTANLSSGAAVFADPVFQVGGSTDGSQCEVRALGGELDRFAENQEAAFRTRGELTAWAREGAAWRGVLVIDGQRYRVSAEEMRTDRGNIMIGRLARG